MERNAWDEGGASNADKTQREERPWDVKCDANGVCTPITYNPVGSTPCYTVIPGDTTGTRKVSRHIHPFVPYGFPGSEQVPTTVCPPNVETFPGAARPHSMGCQFSSVRARALMTTNRPRVNRAYHTLLWTQ